MTYGQGGSMRGDGSRRGGFLAASVVAAVLAFGAARSGHALETEAQQALIIDFETGSVLLDKNSDERMPPSSMSKMMTVFALFERLKDGRLSLEDSLSVSKKAWKMGGSKMFVEVDGRVRVEDIIRGIVIQSGNDACVVVAEGLAGSEEAFGELITRRAHEIGMKDSNFVNASGWPDPNHFTTARDLVTLASETIRRFPEYYHYYSEKDFTYSGIQQGNRNPLLFKEVGADGLKTGHTEAGGYGLTASAVRGGRRLVMVLNGLPSIKARAIESERLMDWAFREFDNYALFRAGDAVDEANVWLGDKARVPLVIQQDLTVTLPRKSRKGMKVSVVYDGPVPTPIPLGAPIASLRIEAPDVPTREVPLVAGAEVGELGLFGKLVAAFQYILWGGNG